MSEELATVSDYDGLIQALIARQTVLGLTNETVETLAGLADGSLSKIYGRHRSRSLGRLSLGLLLKTIAVKLVVVRDPAAESKLAGRYKQREQRLPTAVAHRSFEVKLSRQFMRKIAKKAAVARMRKISPRRRKVLARHAARARWRAVRERDTCAAAALSAPG